ncbi:MULTISPECIES: phage head closure protein [Clostridium]|uniref:Phage head-tail adaptor n=2 Tax=Clostridium botulinum TaxID=1491 RepID=A0A3F3A586_CLOB6|nr:MULTISPECIES: phage head closure protein [Clostridium]ACQ52336.1 putative phage head-tail adaptor [Clostridium botulinum Ba4 str. 657]APU60235.1 phage head-tail joining family protein [Clostridium botulinum]
MLTKKQIMNNLSIVFNKKISILQFKDVKNEIRDTEQKLVEINEMWAFITSLAKGAEYLENKKIQQKLIYKIIIRKTSIEINQSMFIKYEEKLFNIKDIVDINSPYITLFVEEKESEQNK